MSRLSATFIVWLCFFINMGKSNLSSTNFISYKLKTKSARLSHITWLAYLPELMIVCKQLKESYMC